jgi:hypothetical protein
MNTDFDGANHTSPERIVANSTPTWRTGYAT